MIFDSLSVNSNCQALWKKADGDPKKMLQKLNKLKYRSILLEVLAAAEMDRQWKEGHRDLYHKLITIKTPTPKSSHSGNNSSDIEQSPYIDNFVETLVNNVTIAYLRDEIDWEYFEENPLLFNGVYFLSQSPQVSPSSTKIDLERAYESNPNVVFIQFSEKMALDAAGLDVLKKFKQLESLILTTFSENNAQKLQDLCKECPHLKNLVFLNDCKLDDACLKALQGSNLEKLAFHADQSFSMEGLAALLESLPHFKGLFIHMPKKNAEVLEQLLPPNNPIREFHVKSNTMHTGS